MKPYLIAIIILSFISSLLGGITYFNIIDSHKKEAEEPFESFYMNELIKASIENECVGLNNSLVYSGNDSENSFPLFDVVNEECIVFRFSGEACNVCVDFVMEKLKSRFEDFEENKRILLIGSNINSRVKEKYYGRPVL
ncbi:MAG TPA: hypothetical protein PLV06_04405 [Bacteroidales bacterium]|nr:hypothetical protein [Bacteroidales bacterium]HPJ58273.1 hypothetical protein [Bacteroidales bacterium]HPR11604.1 hypothetical protein [Bacteroidales bacterium]HRW85439.1 hypothetical protein [Bacteroidales bacterium]